MQSEPRNLLRNGTHFEAEAGHTGYQRANGKHPVAAKLGKHKHLRKGVTICVRQHDQHVAAVAGGRRTLSHQQELKRGELKPGS